MIETKVVKTKIPRGREVPMKRHT